MRKTKILALFLAIVTIMASFACFPTFAATDNGTVFDNYHVYSTKEVFSKFPATVEATIYFPADFPKETEGGVILGSYKDEKTSFFSFEIASNGIPRVVLQENKQTYSYVFDQVNVLTGKEIHIAFTIDSSAGIVTCYINGAKAQERKQRIPSTLTNMLKSIVGIGGDNRLVASDAISKYNSNYFKGSIKNVSIYSDVRTAAEIQADYANKTYDTDNLIGYYEPIQNAEKFSDKNGKGPDFVMRYTWAANPEEINLDEVEFSFAVVGDTQILVRDTPDKFTGLYDWILNNLESQKIECVIGLGDITDQDSNVEWNNAKAEISRLNGKIPYTIVRGNHDSQSKYTNYFRYKDYAKYATDGALNESMLNTYKKLNINGNKYLILNIDCGAGYTKKDAEAVMAWANQVVVDHSDHNVIVTTHIYLDGAGKLVKQSSNPDRYGYYGGEELWNNLVRKHENISMVLSGHVDHDHIGFSQQKGDHGNTVTQFMIDPQGVDRELGGIGMVAMFYFTKGGTRLDVRYYSTVYDLYFSPASQLSNKKIHLIDAGTDTTDGDQQAEDPDAASTDTADGGSDASDSKSGFNPLLLLLLIPVVIAIAVVIYFVATMNNKPKEAKKEEGTEEESTDENKSDE